MRKDFFVFVPDWAKYGVEDDFECTRFEGLLDQVDCRIMHVTSL